MRVSLERGERKTDKKREKEKEETSKFPRLRSPSLALIVCFPFCSVLIRFRFYFCFGSPLLGFSIPFQRPPAAPKLPTMEQVSFFVCVSVFWCVLCVFCVFVLSVFDVGNLRLSKGFMS